MAVILIALGLIITGIDKWYVLDIAYPAFHVAGAVGKHELSPSIQLYTTGNILGDHVKIDLLPDALGCFLFHNLDTQKGKHRSKKDSTKNIRWIMDIKVQP